MLLLFGLVVVEEKFDEEFNGNKANLGVLYFRTLEQIHKPLWHILCILVDILKQQNLPHDFIALFENVYFLLEL